VASRHQITQYLQAMPQRWQGQGLPEVWAVGENQQPIDIPGFGESKVKAQNVWRRRAAYGLLLLAAGYVSIGIFASSITNNQIVSFLVAALLCFFMYTGFSSIASFELLGAADNFILNLGMQAHYNSLSRGLIDSRDVVYFIALIVIFLLLTKTVLSARKW
jgi:hypothetical protein